MLRSSLSFRKSVVESLGWQTITATMSAFSITSFLFLIQESIETWGGFYTDILKEHQCQIAARLHNRLFCDLYQAVIR